MSIPRCTCFPIAFVQCIVFRLECVAFELIFNGVEGFDLQKTAVALDFLFN